LLYFVPIYQIWVDVGGRRTVAHLIHRSRRTGLAALPEVNWRIRDDRALTVRSAPITRCLSSGATSPNPMSASSIPIEGIKRAGRRTPKTHPTASILTRRLRSPVLYRNCVFTVELSSVDRRPPILRPRGGVGLIWRWHDPGRGTIHRGTTLRRCSIRGGEASRARSSVMSR
jgi:hypothetical protein